MENPTSPSVAEPIPEMNTPVAPGFTPPKLPTLPGRSLAIGVGLSILVVVIAAISYAGYRWQSAKSASTSTVRPISLTYWGMSEDSEAFSAARKQFEADHPGVTINYSVQSPKDYSERLISACGRNQCPDIFRFHSTWTAQYNRRGLLAPIPTTILSSQSFEQTYYPAAITDLKSSSGYLGIPLMYDGLGLYINKRILQASGRSVPTTWDELRSLARELTVIGADGNIDRAGVALGTSNNVDHFSDILATLIYQNGGNPLKPESVGSNSQSSAQSGTGQAALVGDALTFYTQFAKTDKIWNETMPNSTYAFAIERTAMIIAPAYRAAEIKKINPNFEFAVYPIPQLPGTPVTNANYWVEGVAKTSPEQEMAWTFLKYLGSKEVLQKIHPVGGGKILKEVYPRKDMAELLSADPYAGAIITQASSARSTYLASRTFDKGVNDALVAAYSEIVTKIASGSRYEELAAKFPSTISEVLQTYGLLTDLDGTPVSTVRITPVTQ